MRLKPDEATSALSLHAASAKLRGPRIGLATLVGCILLHREMPPFFMPWPLPLAVFGIVLGICTVAAVLGIRKIRRSKQLCADLKRSSRASIA